MDTYVVYIQTQRGDWLSINNQSGRHAQFTAQALASFACTLKSAGILYRAVPYGPQQRSLPGLPGNNLPDFFSPDGLELAILRANTLARG